VEQIPRPYKTRLKAMPHDELRELAESVEELQSHPGWAGLMMLCDEGTENLQRDTHQRGVLEQAQYAYRNGFLFGVDQPREIVRAIREVYTAERERLEAKAKTEAREAEEATA
jgi:hypothetical protein